MSKPLFSLGTSPIARLIVVVAIGLVLIGLDHRLNQLQGVRHIAASVVHPLQLAAEVPLRMARRIGDSFSSRENLVTENQLLHDELLVLRARQMRYDALRRENERLRALLNTASQRDDRVQIAKLLAIDLDPFRQQIVINRGRRDGAYPGQPLLHAEGIIGQIVNAYEAHSTAILISDPGHALPVINGRTELRSLLVGTGNPSELRMRYVPVQEDVRVGDPIQTSGLDGRFPPDYPVGVVTSATSIPGEAFLDVRVAPLIALDRSREVLLLWPEPRSSRETPTPAPLTAPPATPESADAAAPS